MPPPHLLSSAENIITPGSCQAACAIFYRNKLSSIHKFGLRSKNISFRSCFSSPSFLFLALFLLYWSVADYSAVIVAGRHSGGTYTCPFSSNPPPIQAWSRVPCATQHVLAGRAFLNTAAVRQIPSPLGFVCMFFISHCWYLVLQRLLFIYLLLQCRLQGSDLLDTPKIFPKCLMFGKALSPFL